MRCRKARSWVMNSTAPCQPKMRSSSQLIVARSRWLVGSSSSRRSGWLTRALASATRRRQPPDNSPSRFSPGRPSSVSTFSTCCSMCQPPRASICCCSASSSRSPCLSSARADSSRYSSTSACTSVRPSVTVARTVWVSVSGRFCANLLMPMPVLNWISPWSGSSSPVISFSSEVLPAPLRPIRHTRSPASMAIEASRSSTCSPNSRETSSKRIRVMVEAELVKACRFPRRRHDEAKLGGQA